MSVSAGLVGDRYRLYEPVGSGGMGRVWLARDEMLHRDVAIKEVGLPSWLTEAERVDLRARTLREARAAARLSHPNVIQIYDVVQTEAQPWIVMEYIPSRSLQEVITQDGPLSPERAAQVGLAILAGLRTAHNSGVVHRDVKPHNVLIGAGSRVVLTDFGLATFDGGDGAVTRAGLILGSPQFVAPERARAGLSTIESDLWSLGATLYAAVEGHSPYARPTTMATLAALATDAPAPAQHAGSLRPVLNGLLKKDPKQRLTATQTEELLKKAAVGGHRQAPRILPRPRPSRENEQSGDLTEPAPRRRWLLTATITALVTFAALAAVIASLGNTGGGGNERPTVTGPSTGPPSLAAIQPFTGTKACTANLKVPTKQLLPPTQNPSQGLLSNYVWHLDPRGFKLPVQASWQYFTSGDVVCFRGSSEYPVMGVDMAVSPKQPAMTTAERAEAALKSSSEISRYQQWNLVPIADYGADWEYQYQTKDGKWMHAWQRILVAKPTMAYSIFWITPSDVWPSQLENYRPTVGAIRPTD